MCVYIHIYIYIVCIHIYIYIYLVRHGNRQDAFFYCFRRRHHPTFLLWFPSFFFYGFGRRRKRFLLWFPSLLFFIGFRRGRITFLFNGFRRWILVDSAAAGGSTILECIERFLVVFCVFRTGFRRWFCLMVSVVAGKYV